MKQRCCNSRCKAFKNYGARGITVCNEWLSFDSFYKWAINNGYKKGLDLDRCDNEKGYSPDNCRWISRKININNRRNTIKLTINGITKSRTEWEEISGIPKGTIKAWVITHGTHYAEKRLSDSLKSGYKQKDYGYSHRKKIVHEDTGIIFNSVREAAKYFGIAPCTISNAMRENRKTGKGRFNWEEIE